jgi:hypothetical protein
VNDPTIANKYVLSIIQMLCVTLFAPSQLSINVDKIISSKRMDTLTLSRAIRQIGANQTPREYFDFIVSGKSLRTILNIDTSDYITLFGWGTNKEYDKHILNVFRLKEKSQIDSGRVMIYGCAECGDIDCGAITAIIKDYGDRIIWSDFGYETNYGGLTETYNQVEPIEFDRASYFSAFSKIPV